MEKTSETHTIADGTFQISIGLTSRFEILRFHSTRWPIASPYVIGMGNCMNAIAKTQIHYTKWIIIVRMETVTQTDCIYTALQSRKNAIFFDMINFQMNSNELQILTISYLCAEWILSFLHQQRKPIGKKRKIQTFAVHRSLTIFWSKKHAVVVVFSVLFAGY